MSQFNSDIVSGSETPPYSGANYQDAQDGVTHTHSPCIGAEKFSETTGKKLHDKSSRSSDDGAQTQTQTKMVDNITILKYLLDSLSGRDKFAKIIKYALDILKLFIEKSKKKLVTVDSSVLTYYTKVLKNLTLKVALRHPVTVIKVLVLSILKNFDKKIDFISQQLSTFRYILRFGGTPFRLFSLLGKFNKTRKCNFQIDQIKQIWFNETSLREFLDLYYGIFDELDLLYKFKIWSNKSFYSFVSRQESLAWQYDILLSLKDNWLNLQRLQRRQLELEVQLKVQNDALLLSPILMHQAQNDDAAQSPIRKQLLHDLNVDNKPELLIRKQLRAVKDEKTLVYLDITRLTFDCMANTTDVLNLKTPKGTYAVLSLGSGLTGLVKLWITAKRSLCSSKD
ncbi:pex25p [Saccharomyces arboricola H-6]|uniref:Pex25p n=1 Tax=Saccharomyces arboricola (strain H-6 / AS 2.3317 / CBS 10644) TaxID=1160507 RepID=J8Q1B1_SACAR|nr:pex25p [Saccharomyces arboricola H-6]